MRFVLAAVMLVVCVATVILVPRAIRDMRVVDREWRRRWRALGAEQRRSIMRALRRGEPIYDHEDAELALGAIAHAERTDRATRPLRWLHVPASLALMLFGLTVGRPVTAIIAAFWLATIALSEAVARWQRRRFQRSVERTRSASPMMMPSGPRRKQSR